LIPATIGGHVAVADASCNGIQGPCLWCIWVTKDIILRTKRFSPWPKGTLEKSITTLTSLSGPSCQNGKWNLPNGHLYFLWLSLGDTAAWSRFLISIWIRKPRFA
jgi:hypothetical protein